MLQVWNIGDRPVLRKYNFICIYTHRHKYKDEKSIYYIISKSKLKNIKLAVKYGIKTQKFESQK